MARPAFDPMSERPGAGVFDLTGLTRAQREIIEDALARCTFDFSMLLPGLRAAGLSGIKVSFRDLSDYGTAMKPGKVISVKPARAAGAWGLAYTDGRLHIDRSLSHEEARMVFMVEAGHMVDFFLLDDSDREALIAAMHQGPGPRPGWWEGSYYRQMGEAFSSTFAVAFSDYARAGDIYDWAATPKAVAAVRQRLSSTFRLNEALRAFREGG